MVNIEKKIISFSTCINCNKKFSQSEIEASHEIKKGKDATLVHINCKKCDSSMLMGLVSGKGMGIVGVATDLTATDVIKHYDKKRITTDELIELSDVINSI